MKIIIEFIIIITEKTRTKDIKLDNGQSFSIITIRSYGQSLFNLID